jgi:hypothetical protein
MEMLECHPAYIVIGGSHRNMGSFFYLHMLKTGVRRNLQRIENALFFDAEHLLKRNIDADCAAKMKTIGKK